MGRINVGAKTWIAKHPHIYERTRREMRNAYPSLRPIERDGRLIYKGPFEVRDSADTGVTLEPFQLEIELPDHFPDDFPIVRETAGRVPNSPDRHTFKNGTACVGTPPDLWFHYADGFSLVTFLGEEVSDWCIFQICKENGVRYPYGERSHGTGGLLESLCEKFQTRNPGVVVNYLDILSKRELRGHWKCPCDSGKKLRECHIAQMRDIKLRISTRRARSVAKLLAIHLSEGSWHAPLAVT